jgi:hypothetical protein
MLKIMYDVETSDLKTGDVVFLNSEGSAAHFVGHGRTFEDSDYVEIVWSESVPVRSTFTTTAQPWNTWSSVIREV